MKIKDNSVNIKELDINIMLILGAVEKICKNVNGKDYQVTITSARDGLHKKGSLHYAGKALDIRTKDMKNIQLTCVCLRNALKWYGKYDVILEKDHIHIEYDVK